MLEPGEVRRSHKELLEQAEADAQYFFGEQDQPAAPPLSGMALAPSLQPRPDYSGPVRTGMAAGAPVKAAPAKTKADPYATWSQPQRGKDGKMYRLSPDRTKMILVNI